MRKFIRTFNMYDEYEAFTESSEYVIPNISWCRENNKKVHYNPVTCEESTVYEIIGTPSYPSTIEATDASFGITVGYRKTENTKWCQVIVTEGTDTVTVECGTNTSESESRTVSGTVDYHGNEIEYSVIQNKFETNITATFNVTSTSNPTRIIGDYSINPFSAIEIDGVIQTSMPIAYSFSTTGEHTVKYVLSNSTTISKYAFYGCSAMTNCTIGSGVTSIGECAFSNCSGLTGIVIPDSVITIGYRAFGFCSGLTSCTIGSGVTSIGEYAFSNCSGLTSIDIQDSVITVGQYAFLYCVGLTDIAIGSGVTSIGYSAFQGCKSISSIIVDSNNTTYDSRNNCDAIIKTNTNLLVYGCKNTIIPNTVTSIGGGAFEYCSGLTSIDIPNSVTSIGNEAFAYCYNLTSSTIGSGITSIGNYAFMYCSVLSSVTIYSERPPSLGGDSVFDGNAGDRKIYVLSPSAYRRAMYWEKYSSYIYSIPE